MATDGYPSCRFYVQVDGLNQAVFTEMSGLQVETDVLEYDEGGNNGFTHRLPGRTKIGMITLKRGMTSSNDFFSWCNDILQGKIKPRHVSVIMYDTAGNEMTRWNFANAYPVRWSGPQFTADARTTSVESLELAHDGLVPN